MVRSDLTFNASERGERPRALSEISRQDARLDRVVIKFNDMVLLARESGDILGMGLLLREESSFIYERLTTNSFILSTYPTCRYNARLQISPPQEEPQSGGYRSQLKIELDLNVTRFSNAYTDWDWVLEAWTPRVFRHRPNRTRIRPRNTHTLDSNNNYFSDSARWCAANSVESIFELYVQHVLQDIFQKLFKCSALYVRQPAATLFEEAYIEINELPIYGRHECAPIISVILEPNFSWVLSRAEIYWEQSADNAPWLTEQLCWHLHRSGLDAVWTEHLNGNNRVRSMRLATRSQGVSLSIYAKTLSCVRFEVQYTKAIRSVVRAPGLTANNLNHLYPFISAVMDNAWTRFQLIRDVFDSMEIQEEVALNNLLFQFLQHAHNSAVGNEQNFSRLLNILLMNGVIDETPEMRTTLQTLARLRVVSRVRQGPGRGVARYRLAYSYVGLSQLLSKLSD